SLMIGAFSGASGAMSMSNGATALSASGGVTVGALGTGSYLQIGGSLSTPSFSVGLAGGSFGTATVSGGNFAAPLLSVGVAGNGRFNHSGGVITTTTLALGTNAASFGNYVLSGPAAVLSVLGNEYV